MIKAAEAVARRGTEDWMVCVLGRLVNPCGLMRRVFTLMRDFVKGLEMLSSSSVVSSESSESEASRLDAG
jgi:hypothetical protein